MKFYLFLYSLIIFLCCSNTNHQNIEIKQLKANQPIILKYNKKYNKVTRILLPVKLSIKNKSDKDSYFTSLKYKYGLNSGSLGVSVFKENNNQLIKLKMASKKRIPANGVNEIIIYTRHRIDTNALAQKKFQPYLIVNQNNDSLIIDNYNYFKEKNSSFLKKITTNDSISLNMWGDNSSSKFGKQIKTSVSYPK